MANEIIMPKFGQTVEEAEIVKWHKKVGDKVAKGDVLLEIQTDKATLEVESFYEGVILKTFAKDGDTVPVMSVIGYVGKEGEKVPDAPPKLEKPAEKKEEQKTQPKAEKKNKPETRKKTSVDKPKTTPAPAPTPQLSTTQPAKSDEIFITPRAKKLARDFLIKPEKIQGSGPNGRITVSDVENFITQNGLAELKITPVAKELIEQNDLDVLEVRGEGKITKEDVMRALRERPKPLSPMRQIIAKRMMESVSTMPHFFVTMKIDVTDLLAYRKQAKATGLKASVGDFITKACALTLREMPVMNSACIADTVKTNQSVNIGIAVALNDGLIVPVIRDADILSLNELAETSKDLAKRARENKLMPEEFQGGTFTISNMGMLGVDQFTAIINPGEGAILAVGAAVDTPVVKKGEVVVRTIMKMTLSSDHRIIDGAVAARFLKALKNKLEDIGLWQNI